MEQKRKILTIDDDHNLRESIVFYFEDCGYLVEEASTGKEGLAKARETEPDVILLDLRMPGMDGIQVLRKIASSAVDIPVIIVSGAADIQDAIEALRHGAWDFKLKPIYDMAILEASVRRAIDHKQLSLENQHYRQYLEEEVKKQTSALREEVALHQKLEQEKLELERQVRKSQKMEALGTLAGGIAHDFNNILTAVLGYAELGQFTISDTDKTMKCLTNITTAGNRAKELVDQILLFCRQSEKNAVSVPIEPLIRETIKLLRASLPSSIQIESRIEPNCPPVIADPSQMHQVLMNLCTNAKHAMPDGGILEIQLQAGTNDSGDEVTTLLVKDSGTGIPPELKERIFEPYFTTKQRKEGTGLGLSVVHGIIQELGGRITVASEVGVGTSFSVELPVAPIWDGKDLSLDKVPDLDEMGGNERILLVDDEEMILVTMKSLLEIYGYNVNFFDDPERALDLFAKDPSSFDLIVTDYSMPNISGVHLAERVHVVRSDIPILLISGYSDLVNSDETAKALGFAGMLSKPFSSRELVSTIRKVFNTAQAPQQENGE